MAYAPLRTRRCAATSHASLTPHRWRASSSPAGVAALALVLGLVLVLGIGVGLASRARRCKTSCALRGSSGARIFPPMAASSAQQDPGGGAALGCAAISWALARRRRYHAAPTATVARPAATASTRAPRIPTNHLKRQQAVR